MYSLHPRRSMSMLSRFLRPSLQQLGTSTTRLSRIVTGYNWNSFIIQLAQLFPLRVFLGTSTFRDMWELLGFYFCDLTEAMLVHSNSPTLWRSSSKNFAMRRSGTSQNIMTCPLRWKKTLIRHQGSRYVWTLIGYMIETLKNNITC